MSAPTIDGTDVGTLCSTCLHDLGDHRFATVKAYQEGELVDVHILWCPDQNCPCVSKDALPIS